MHTRVFRHIWSPTGSVASPLVTSGDQPRPQEGIPRHGKLCPAAEDCCDPGRVRPFSVALTSWANGVEPTIMVCTCVCIRNKKNAVDNCNIDNQK